MDNRISSLAPVELAIVAATALVIALIIIWPSSRIVRRAGLPSWLAIFAVVPLLNLVLLYVVAFTRWPGEQPERGHN
jgi:hypothetical protein